MAVGAAVLAVVTATARTSGGHANPALSLAAVIRSALPVGELVPYRAAQLLGGLAAYLLLLVIYTAQLDGYPGSFDLGGLVLAAFVAELVFSFALAGTVVIAPVSAAALNPVVAFTMALAGVLEWKWLPVYVLAQLLGAVLAGLMNTLQPDTGLPPLG